MAEIYRSIEAEIPRLRRYARALVRDLTIGKEQADAALRAEDLARFASLVAHGVGKSFVMPVSK